MAEQIANEIRCWKCGTTLSISSGESRDSVRCPSCSATVPVPMELKPVQVQQPMQITPEPQTASSSMPLWARIVGLAIGLIVFRVLVRMVGC
jgi:DNA-directed RNA polymerase subunit RPC12/RpoP